MPWTALGPVDWAQEQFGPVDLGDKRLNRRVVKVAAAMAADPAGSIPKQNRHWKQTKGAYRLFDHERATFESISDSHWQRTREQCAQAKTVLLIQDTTWLDYHSHRQTQGLGWNNRCKKQPRGGRGLFLHSVLAVQPQEDGSGRVLGLAWGKLWARSGESIGKNQKRRSRHRRSEDRESLRWTQAVQQIGSPPAATGDSQSPPRWLHVGDRESDIFDLYQQTQKISGVGFVIRVSKDRNASIGHDTPQTLSRQERASSSLKDLCRAMPRLGEKKLWIGPKANRPGRWASLSVSGGPVTLWSPQLNRTGHALRCWAVRVWEENPPEGEEGVNDPEPVEAVEWILLTSEPVKNLQDALRIAGYYTLRWLIEQYHQCLKSGCKVEERQLESADRLEPLIGMLCAVAVRLLQLKNDARLWPDRPAKQCVPQELVSTLCKLIEADAASMTVRRFTHEVAKLGGFLGRKSDGEPGWRTLWQGWHELSLIHAGFELARAQGRYG